MRYGTYGAINNSSMGMGTVTTNDLYWLGGSVDVGIMHPGP